jgi:hypothetical protein
MGEVKSRLEQKSKTAQEQLPRHKNRCMGRYETIFTTKKMDKRPVSWVYSSQKIALMTTCMTKATFASIGHCGKICNQFKSDLNHWYKQ